MDESDSTEVKFEVCPCCGKPTLKKPLEPGKELTDIWLSCLVSGVPFTHTYNMYDGRIKLTVSIITSEQLSKLTEALSVLDYLQTSMKDRLADMDWQTIRRNLCLYLALPSIEVRTENNVKNYTPLAVVLDCLSAVVQLRTNADQEDVIEKLRGVQQTLTAEALLSALPVTMLVATIETHKRVNALMVDAGFSGDFWSGIVLA